MKFVCSPRGLTDPKYPVQGVRDVRSAFAMTVLDGGIFAGGKRGDKSFVDSTYNVFLKACQAQGLATPIAYAPALASTDELSLRENLRYLVADTDELRRAIRVILTGCEDLGTEYLIIPPLAFGIDSERNKNGNLEFFSQLLPEVKKTGVKILLINRVKFVGGRPVRGIGSNPGWTLDLLNRLNEMADEERFGFALDMVACTQCGQNVYEIIDQLHPFLKAVIVGDSEGGGVKRLLPFISANNGHCTTDWLNSIRGLREIGFDGYMVLSLDDTAGAFPPLLRPSLMKLARETANYLAWQIDMEQSLARYSERVLFGAGVMCRNYMASFGKKYPPLFTCDNNESLWGTQVAGLMVKSPEELHGLPSGCGIFICNIYYREIEAQLRNMGITNPIEYFNDECLAVMNVDSLPTEGI